MIVRCMLNLPFHMGCESMQASGPMSCCAYQPLVYCLLSVLEIFRPQGGVSDKEVESLLLLSAGYLSLSLR